MIMEKPLLPLENNVKGKITCILLCAGEGTRIKNYIGQIPKPLISLPHLSDKPILYDTINKLLICNINKIIIITGYLKQNIEEFIRNLKVESPQSNEKIVIYDSEFEYKKGSLYSFLSFTNNAYYFTEKMIYMLLPGDTIFDFELLNEIIIQSYKLLNKEQGICIIPFRKIKISSLKELYTKDRADSAVLISIAKIKTKKGKIILKNIIQKDLSSLSRRKYVFQIIPCFMFNFNFIQIIINISQKSDITTLREAINLSLKNTHNVYLHQIEENLNFFDIDTIQDLKNLKNKKKKVDNSSSDNLRNQGTKT
jgi:choline kinase